jgi:Do/DeqQ family serine protease
MQRLMQHFKLLMGFLVITAISPFILAKLGFWETTFAADPQFKAPYPSLTTQQGPHSYAPAVKRAAPAVVSIHSTKAVNHELHPFFNDPFFRHFFGDPNTLPSENQPSVGSGVIVSPQGYILTNNHVTKDADDIKVKLSDGRCAPAKLIGSDPESDLAILQIKLDDLPVIAIIDSEALQVGDVVLAIGNPFGVGQTVTMGIVSATQRNELGINTIENFIQTDAAINPGNSGGALINADGNLVGINNAIYTRTGGYQGIGFAIPTTLAKEVMIELIDQGHVTRGWLGITLRKLNDELRKTLNYPQGEGAVIAGVMRNAPANQAGLEPGDIVTHLNHIATPDPSSVLKVAAKLKPDMGYPITVIRHNEIHDFKVVVGKRPAKPLQLLPMAEP